MHIRLTSQYGVTQLSETLGMTQDAYKAAKESFVSDQAGSTLTHINLISLIAFSALSLFTAYRTRLSWLFPANAPALFVVQFAFLVLPLLGAVTVGAHGSGTNALKWNTAMMAITIMLSARFPAPHHEQKVKQVLPVASPLPTRGGSFSEKHLGTQLSKRLSEHVQKADTDVFRLPAVSTWRAHMMLMTALCILAVDFQVFPRSLVKCETFGVSLMDVGVGSFVFAQGVASALPLLKTPDYLTAALWPKVYTSARKSSPLIALGLVRLLLVKATDYPGEHISEYGTHWNFFLTLAALPPLQALLHPVFQYISPMIVGLCIATGYQLLLTFTPLQTWALYATRTDVISHNKEGIVSLAGYLAIHILGLNTGLVIFPPRPGLGIQSGRRSSKPDQSSDESERESEGEEKDADAAYASDAWIDESKRSSPSKGHKVRRDDRKTVTELGGYGVLYGLLFGVVKMCYMYADEDGVSRRLANLQYILWVTTYNIFFLLLYIVHDLYFFSSGTGRATDAAKQLGPGETAYAPPNYNYNLNPPTDSTSWTTALDQTAYKSTSLVPPPLTRAATTSLLEGTNTRAHLLSPPPFDRPGFGISTESLSDLDDQSDLSAKKKVDPKNKKRIARKSWEGPELVLRKGFADEDEEDGGGSEVKGENARVNKSSKRGVKNKDGEERPEPTSPELLEAVNRNGLVIFLLANVLTGLVNLSMETIYAEDLTAYIILVGYMGVLCTFAWVFRGRRLVRL